MTDDIDVEAMLEDHYAREVCYVLLVLSLGSLDWHKIMLSNFDRNSLCFVRILWVYDPR